MMEEVIEPQMGLGFEQVWAALMETRQRQEETARQMQETDRLIKETDRVIKESQRETDRVIKESQEKVALAIQANTKQMGDLGKRFGEIAEHLIIPNITEKFNALGYKFNFANPNSKLTNPETNEVEAEFDILLENGKYIICVEVKTKPNTQDVFDHIKRLAILKKYKDKEDSKKEIRGAIAGAIMPKNVRELALAKGMYVIEQSGDTVKIIPPEIHSQWEQELANEAAVDK
jgi:hypothetical protein